jgi:hypothetical protein
LTPAICLQMSLLSAALTNFFVVFYPGQIRKYATMFLYYVFLIFLLNIHVLELQGMESIDTFSDRFKSALQEQDMFKVMELFTAHIDGRKGIFQFLMAIARGAKDSVEKSILKGVEINVKIKDGLQPIHLAVLSENLEVVNLLMQHGANIHAKDDFGRESLHLASFGSKKELILLLITHGASIKAADNKGKLPIDYAYEYDHPEYANLLSKNPAEKSVLFSLEPGLEELLSGSNRQRSF